MDGGYERLLTDRVALIKADGRRVREQIGALVASGRIVLLDVSLPLEAGDVLERRLPGGAVERFEVLDPGYEPGLRSLPPCFQARVRRLPRRDPSERTA